MISLSRSIPLSDSAKKILIYLPDPAISMSAGLIQDLCWIGARSNQSDHVVKTISGDGLPVSCFSGGCLAVGDSVHALDEPCDLLFLSAFWGRPEKALRRSAPMIARLSDVHSQGTPIAALSNASFFLAAAGLLDEKTATVYPAQADEFARLFPRVRLKRERAMTDAGELYCANGIASGCDLIVAMLQKLFGSEVARQLSQDFLLGFSRDYTIADVAFDGQKYHGDTQILRAQRHLERDFAQDIRLAKLARELGMSPRNFSRRFKAATGDSASRYLQNVRIEAAKGLLRESKLGMAEIAQRVGYEDLSYFSGLFEKLVGSLPNDYRGSH